MNATPTWREALEFAAETKSTDWPERCQKMVDMARKALMSDLKQKPFAWMLNSEVSARDNKYSGTVWYDDPKRQSANWTPLYVTGAPQQAEAVPPSNLIDPGSVVSFAVDRWLAEVANRPLVNKNRRTLDDTWRQVIRRFGGDPDVLLGPPHDELVAIAQQKGGV